MESLTLPSIFGPIYEAINAVSGWFLQLFTGDWYILIIGVISFVIAGRLLLSPLFGGSASFGGSDFMKDYQDSLSSKISSNNLNNLKKDIFGDEE